MSDRRMGHTATIANITITLPDSSSPSTSECVLVFGGFLGTDTTCSLADYNTGFGFAPMIVWAIDAQTWLPLNATNLQPPPINTALHTATLLPSSGLVVVVGGVVVGINCSHAVLDTVQVLDLASGWWTIVNPTGDDMPWM